MSCPDDGALVAFAEGLLSSTDASSIADHLDRCRACADAVAEAAQAVDGDWASSFTVTGPGRSSPTGRVPSIPRGVEIGRYMVLAPLGKGGLGEVFVGYDPRLDRQVALKVVRPEVARQLDATALQERLAHEARALARLSHPNVVQVYDVGTVGDLLFIAMERVDGVTLREWIRRESPDWQEIRDVFVDAAQGLDAAHAVGLVHRDFKPENVLVDTQGRARILDFGLAQAFDVPTPLTQTPAASATHGDDHRTYAVGTPAYMAPEQYARGPVDARTDQFGFCVALYEALHGRRPFSGDSPRALAAAIREGRIGPHPPAPSVPTWLHRAVLRGLHVDPSRRFPTMRALVKALRRDERSRRRNGWVVAAAIVLSAGLTWGTLTWRRHQVTPEVLTRIEDLTTLARNAARDGAFIHPPLHDPKRITAFQAVVELESIDGPGAALAAAEALELRAEFASMLVGLGDQYWEREPGQAFAADYYGNALLFDPDLERAMQRAMLSRGQLASLRQRAEQGAFPEYELEAAAPLRALAEPDPMERREAVLALVRAQPVPSLQVRKMVELVDERDATASEPPPAPEPSRAKAEPPPPPPAPEPPEPEVEIEPERAQSEPPDPPPSFPRKAADAVKAGRKALRRGAVKRAEQHFHRALRLDRDHTDAVVGLGEVMFQRGHYRRALELSRRAMRQSSDHAGAAMLEGNCFFRMLRYDQALAAYQRAEAAGHGGARRRIEHLKRLMTPASGASGDGS